MILEENFILERRDEDFSGIETSPILVGHRGIEVYPQLLIGSPLKALDLSRFQLNEVKDVDEIWNAGYRVVILQATYGLKADPSFPIFWPILLARGFTILTYHLLLALWSGIEQAHNHLETVQPLWKAQGRRYPAFEDVEVRDGASVQARQNVWYTWAKEIRKETKPGTYCSLSLWKELMGNIPLGDQLGWCAAWNPFSSYTLPTGWTKEQTIMRQIGVSKKHSWVPIVPGMAGDVDVDAIYLTSEQLYQLGVGESTSPPPQPIPDPGDNDMDTLEKAKVLRNKLVALESDVAITLSTVHSDILSLDDIIHDLQATPVPVPTPTPNPIPTPEPDPSQSWKVVEDPRTNARCFENWNEEKEIIEEKWNTPTPPTLPKPVMQVYQRPGTGTAAGGRIQYAKGAIVKMLPEIVVADGGVRYMEVYKATGVHGERLFIPKLSLAKVG